MKFLMLNYREIHKHLDKPFFLPVGTVEAHGGGPIGTDVIIPEYIVKKLAERFDGVEMPSIPYGITNSLYGYPGSIDVGDIFEEYIFRIGRSLRNFGVRYLFIINGHGGQIEELKNASSRLWKEHKLHTAVISWWIACDDVCREYFGNLTGHSGSDEYGFVAHILGLDFEEWNREIRYFATNGVNAYPSPGTIIHYGEGEGRYPEKETVERFVNDIMECIYRRVEYILNLWRRLDI